MAKSTTIRVAISDYKTIKKTAKKEGRTIIGLVRCMVQKYLITPEINQ